MIGYGQGKVAHDTAGNIGPDLIALPCLSHPSGLLCFALLAAAETSGVLGQSGAEIAQEKTTLESSDLFVQFGKTLSDLTQFTERLVLLSKRMLDSTLQFVHLFLYSTQVLFNR